MKYSVLIGLRNAMLMLAFTAAFSIYAQQKDPKPHEHHQWQSSPKKMLKEDDPEFFKTQEARRIGDQVLLWQRNTGGWPKNIDMVTPMSEKLKAEVLADKNRRDDSTTDNDATNMQMTYLARLYKATGDVKYRDAFRKGVEYLLSGQYENGGWPQFWPEQRDYQPHITYNDNAMVNTLLMLRDIHNATSPYDSDLCDPKMKKSLKKAFDKGVDCIIATQIVTDGVPTVWCQQHDHVTLEPAPARAYELPSYCAPESSSIVKLLMEIPNPSKKVKTAIHAAMAWFDKYKLTGLTYRRVLIDGAWEAQLNDTPNSTEPLWARYYDLGHCIPFVCDRDGIPRRNITDIGKERRNGYSWYSGRPAELYEIYDKWADKYDPENKVKIDLHSKGANENGTFILGVEPKVDETLFDVVVKRGENIQAAIEKAPENGTKPFKILIKKGVYNQKVIIDRPNIVLVGEHRDSCIIVGAEARNHFMIKEHNGAKVHQGIVILTDKADDCLISGLTMINNYGTTVTNTTNHQFTVYGKATRTIILNSNIVSDGNDALSLWGAGEDGKGGMYYHSDLFIRCPGVDFICPRGTCYATRCRFLGDTRAILWHDGRGDKDNKFVIKDSEFDALKPTPLGRYHHDSQFYLLNCHLSKNIIDKNIDHAYRREIDLGIDKGKPIDMCPWGHRVYFDNCVREGGHNGWLDNNMKDAKDSPEYHTVTASWTFGGKWDPEKRIRDLWHVIAY
ncbi:MAG: pectate lyase [Muribaculum sp.]|nr:pectate lyase [Muribaculum sp.]